MNILEAQNLHYTYPDGCKALTGVSFHAEKGQFVAVLGTNGSGKTTLLHHFNGLLTPQAGTVCLDGRDIRHLPRERVFQEAGLVFQDPNDQLFAATVFEDVSYGPANLGLPPAEVKRRVEEALKMVGGWDLAHRRINGLSYGQKKRVAIAGVLALRPAIIILDEPTAGLDPQGVSRLFRLLRDLQRGGLTIIISTHDVDVVPVYCDRVWVMSRGQVVMTGSPAEIFARPAAVRAVDLRLPRIGHLMEILKTKDCYPLEGIPLTVREARHAISQCHERGERHAYPKDPAGGNQ